MLSKVNDGEQGIVQTIGSVRARICRSPMTFVSSLPSLLYLSLSRCTYSLPRQFVLLLFYVFPSELYEFHFLCYVTNPNLLCTNLKHVSTL